MTLVVLVYLHYPIISSARYGTTLKTIKMILNTPMNEYITTLKVSRGIGNHLLCVRYTKSGANMKNVLHSNNNAPFMIVHHMKKLVSVSISMMLPFYPFASDVIVQAQCR